jgi:hypothetical protein
MWRFREKSSHAASLWYSRDFVTSDLGLLDMQAKDD